MSNSTLSIVDIFKAYGTNSVLRSVSMMAAPGEVHALLGANGAGKSTLLGCISGAVSADSGTITLGDQDLSNLTPKEALNRGIAIIYQELQTINDLTVAENVFLGDEDSGAIGIKNREESATVSRLLQRLGSSAKPGDRVSDLSTGEQKLVDVARALRRKPEVLILDEPTAALSARESERLLSLIRDLAREDNIVVILVTHILRDVLKFADRATVLRDGVVLLSEAIPDVTMEQLVQGISLTGDVRAPSIESKASDLEMLQTHALVGARCGPIDLTIQGGEIVGIYGLLGSGRTDLLESLAGARHVRAGGVSVRGQKVKIKSPQHGIKAGLALVPSDRKHSALFGEMTASENVLLPHLRRINRRIRNFKTEQKAFDGIAKRVQLQPNAPNLEASKFSGGNAQKLSVGRWISELAGVSMLLVDEPTQGVDVGARAEIYELMREFVANGDRAVLFASSDPEEVVAVATRILVMSKGKVVAMRTDRMSESELISLANEE